MHRMGNQFLTGPRFAANEHGRIGRGYLSDLLVDLAHAATMANDVGKVIALPQFLAQVLVLITETLSLGLDEVMDIDRLGNHGGHHMQEFQLSFVVAILAEAQVNAEGADRPPVNDHGDTNERTFLSL